LKSHYEKPLMVSVLPPDIAPHPDLAWQSRRAIIFRSAA
jgi:hypothetical protein